MSVNNWGQPSKATDSRKRGEAESVARGWKQVSGVISDRGLAGDVGDLL